VPAPEGYSSGGTSARAPGYDRDIDALNRQVEGLRVALEDMQKKVRGLELALASRPIEAAPAAAGEGGGEADTPAVAYSAYLEEQVSAILDKRAEEERKEQTRRRVEGMARFLLRDIQLTDDQQSNFIEVLAAYWDERARIMRQEYPTNEDRQAAVDGLTSDRNVKLQGILGSQYAQVSERLDRTNRGFAGRGNRGPSRRGGGTGR
jgi:hypothetical protein